MPRTTSKWRDADLRRAIKVATAAGLPIGGVEIAPDGIVRLLMGEQKLSEEAQADIELEEYRRTREV